MTERRTPGSLVLIHVDAYEPDRTAAVVAPLECPELPHVHALADGELGPREAVRVRRHLAGCAPCRSELAFLVQLAMAIARGVLALGEATGDAGDAIDRPG